ncbi:MAG: outer membrane beta-barrel protein [Lewinella sp.]|nr:outer membrane beta-barrel protein [Lewinella sp.]
MLSPLSAQFPPGGASRPGPGPSINGYVKGAVIDDATGQPVEFATVVLLSSGGEKQLDGLVTEADGSFKLNNVKTGKYWLRISFIGYEELTLQSLETNPRKPDLDLGQLSLRTDAVALDAVEVVGQAALVENRIDKLVYNAEKDATNSAGDASDVLRKVPLLSVDLEGNVSLRGSSNLLILVNGRPSTIFASSVADALKTIPADQIKSVEVITTPSARYDGEGSGGIINIITKKTDAQGFTGSASGSIGTRQNNAGLNVNALRNRFGFNGGLNSFWSWRRAGESSFSRRDFDGNATIRQLNQTGENANRVVGINGSGGAFYDFNAYNALNASFRYNSFQRFNDGLTTGRLLEPNSSEQDFIDFSRFSDGRSNRGGFDLTTDYRKSFPTRKDQELILALQISGQDSRETNVVDQTGPIEFYQRDLLNANDGLNLEYTAQLDYVQPLGENGNKIETGVKSVLRRIKSDYQTSSKASEASPAFVIEPTLTDLFFYDQDVYAAYSVSISTSVKMGLVGWQSL